MDGGRGVFVVAEGGKEVGISAGCGGEERGDEDDG